MTREPQTENHTSLARWSEPASAPPPTSPAIGRPDGVFQSASDSLGR